MNKKINLKEIERKAYTSYHQDGLWDIFLGIVFLTVGIRSFTDNVWFTLGIFAAILIPVVGKKFITIPRIGRVKFGRMRMIKQMKLAAVIFISVIVTIALLLLPHLGWTLSISPIVAIWIAVSFGLLAYYMDFNRLFAYGLFFAISEVVWGLFGKPIGPITISISGSVTISVGLVLLISFLRKYPLPLIGERLNEGQRG